MTAHDETPDTSPTGRGTPGREDLDREATPGPKRSRRGFLARALGGGTDPDPRFTLANERTFLAWIRTSLALVAGGIAVEAFTSELFDPQLRKTVAVLLLLLGLVTAGGSFFRWLNVERAMRLQAPLPAPVLAPVLAIGGAIVAAILIVFVIGRA
ncbi:MAG TPA: DUF202 domain-containing protein [Arthrobacter sp.]|jgi:putative membrane protein|nr:DUF202 domain-containing protein [Arthrobacter sp.]